VPINLIRSGLKWVSFIPKHSQHKVGHALKEKGLNIDFDNLTPEDLDELIVNLRDLQVDVDGEEIVKVYCE
jgi:predicted RNA-binding protein associated with RNAse of E/G family